MKRATRLVGNSIVIVLCMMLAFGVGLAVRNQTSLQYALQQMMRDVGLSGDLLQIAGTGSMYPTFPKGKSDTDLMRANEIVAWSEMRRYPGGIALGGKRYFGYTLMHGDIVSFSNPLTDHITKEQYGEEAGLVKRVIGLPSDTIEIRDGFIWRNGEQLLEPYTARARSTFGGTFLPDCKKITIPEGQVFVVGDNRTGSNDSRYDVGLVGISDIDHVLPFENQTQFLSVWRDASRDTQQGMTATLDTTAYITALNNKRRDAGLSPLKEQSALISSATKRARHILATNDLSFEATKSGYTMDKAMQEAGYSNILRGESPSRGYITADELIENSFAFPESSEFLLKPEFDDIGVAAVVGSMNGCPAQIIVQHFGGYVPPNYGAEVVSSWQRASKTLHDIQPGWEKLRTYPDYYEHYKKEVDRLLSIITERIVNIDGIVLTMEKNEWLTDAQEAYMEKDEALAKEQDELATFLNNRN